jgi:hypothetical protein
MGLGVKPWQRYELAPAGTFIGLGANSLSQDFSAWRWHLFNFRSAQVEQCPNDHCHHGTLGAGAICRDIGVNLSN